MKTSTSFYASILLCLCLSMTSYSQSFVSVRGSHFQFEGQPYYFLGTNFWYGMNLASQGKGGDRVRLLKELDQLAALGVTNLRIMGGSEGPDTSPWRMAPSLQVAPGVYNEELWDGLDFLLAEMGKRNLKAVVCLNNFWPWSGGFTQYHTWVKEGAIPYPPPAENGSWFKYMLFSSRFYKNPKAMKLYEEHIKRVLNRTNCYTNKRYLDDPTIMSWQLANEPRGMFRFRSYRKWVKKTARFIKSIDANHLVTIGSEGNTSSPTGNHFTKDHSFTAIDYMTIHIWIQNWQWYDPKTAPTSYPKALVKAKKYLSNHLELATKANKPLVLEEFGIARDEDSHDPSANTTWRDRYYAAIFDWVYQKAVAGTPMAGCNFWAWGGAGRPRTAHAIWQAGDDFIGDPPHEHQGWYSVYDKDSSTLAVLKEYGDKMAEIGKKR